MRFQAVKSKSPGTKLGGGISVEGRAPSWLKTPWHYATLGYRGQQLGLLVETDDEEDARREAEDLCTRFGGDARVLSVQKVMIQ